MSRSWPRVMSPIPGRSTLITSAPNQARSCVQVGPDWTWVKSRMRTPSNALPIFLSDCLVAFRLGVDAPHRPRQGSFLAQHALRIEIANPAALATGGGIDHRIDECRLAGIHGRIDSSLQFVRCRHMGA